MRILISIVSLFLLLAGKVGFAHVSAGPRVENATSLTDFRQPGEKVFASDEGFSLTDAADFDLDEETGSGCDSDGHPDAFPVTFHLRDDCLSALVTHFVERTSEKAIRAHSAFGPHSPIYIQNRVLRI